MEEVPEVTAAQPTMGERLYDEASLNWADYTVEKMTEDTTAQPTMGERLYEALLNWADFTVEEVPEVTVVESTIGERLYEVSLNWADYVEVTELTNELPELSTQTAGAGRPQ